MIVCRKGRVFRVDTGGVICSVTAARGGFWRPGGGQRFWLSGRRFDFETYRGLASALVAGQQTDRDVDDVNAFQ